MATEINSYARDDVSQSTSPIICSRLILASSRNDSPGRYDRLVARYDALVAFCHAPASGKIAVIPPQGIVESGCCWFLQKGHVWHQGGEQVLGQHCH